MQKCMVRPPNPDAALEEIDSFWESRLESPDIAYSLQGIKCAPRVLKSIVVGAACIMAFAGDPSPSIAHSNQDEKSIQSLLEHVEQTHYLFVEVQDDVQLASEKLWFDTIDAEEINSEIQIISTYMKEMSEFYSNRKKNFRF